MANSSVRLADGPRPVDAREAAAGEGRDDDDPRGRNGGWDPFTHPDETQ
jgi:hypothetical protein